MWSAWEPEGPHRPSLDTGNAGAPKEIAARLAVRVGSGIITDALDLEACDEGPVANQSVSAAYFSTWSRVSKGTPIITVEPNSAAVEAATATGSVEALNVAFGSPATGTKVTGRTPRESTGRPELTEAAIVVSGGRGVNGAENLALIEALARCPRGRRRLPRRRQRRLVPAHQPGRQIGKSVSPRLYIASGISGAIQHRVSMQTKTIVAVNEDAEAPIFDRFDYGAVGDLFDVVPPLSPRTSSPATADPTGAPGGPGTCPFRCEPAQSLGIRLAEMA